MSEENQSQSSQLSLNFVIFILAILVVANTEKEEWIDSIYLELAEEDFSFL